MIQNNNHHDTLISMPEENNSEMDSNLQTSINHCVAIRQIAEQGKIDQKWMRVIGQLIKNIKGKDGASFFSQLCNGSQGYDKRESTEFFNSLDSLPLTCDQIQQSGLCPKTCQLMEDTGKKSPVSLAGLQGAQLRLTADLLEKAEEDDALEELLNRIKSTKNPVKQKTFILKLKEKTGLGVTDIRALLKEIPLIDEERPFVINGKINHIEAAKFIADRYIIMHNENDFFQYRGGIWQKMSRDDLESLIHNEIAEFSKNNHIFEIVNSIKRARHVKEETIKAAQDRMKIAVENGVLDVETMELHPFKQEHYQFKKMNAAFQKEAKCLQFMNLLDDLFKGDSDEDEKKALLQEICGYLLIPDYKIVKKMFFFYGPHADNGKSSFISIIQGILGDGYFDSVRMSDLKGFLLKRLKGKHANIVGDEKANSSIEDGIIKQLVGEEDRITADRKHTEAINFFNKARLIFSLNQLPRAEQRDEGYFTRVLILEFNNRFLTDPDPNDSRQMKADPSKIELIKEKEKDGILNWMLEGLDRLLKNRQLTIPQSSKEALKKYKLDSNSVLKFVQEQCEFKPKSEVERTTVYQAYKEWCSQNGYKKISAAKFYEATEQKIKGVSQKRTAKQRLLVGIRLK